MFVGQENIAKSELADERPRARRALPEAWGRFCYPVRGMPHMIRLGLLMYYQFGKALKTCVRPEPENPNQTYLELKLALECLHSFQYQTRDMPFPETRAAAQNLEAYLAQLEREAYMNVIYNNDQSVINGDTIERSLELLLAFEKQFEVDSPRLPAFCVTKKGDRDINILLEDASQKFDDDLIKVMPENVLYDVRQAGRCLAFALPTACAFHVCRATEGLMRAYYKKLTGNDWPPPPPKPPMRKDWSTLVDQLAVEGAPKQIINRLKELREDRNSFAHPDVIVPLDEAPIVYDICTGSMFYIAKEML